MTDKAEAPAIPEAVGDVKDREAKLNELFEQRTEAEAALAEAQDRLKQVNDAITASILPTRHATLAECVNGFQEGVLADRDERAGLDPKKQDKERAKALKKLTAVK